MNESVLRCRVRKSGDGYEGTVYVSGIKPSKLTKRDESTVYANRSGVSTAAKALAERLGLTLEVEDTSPTTTKSKKTTATTGPTLDVF